MAGLEVVDWAGKARVEVGLEVVAMVMEGWGAAREGDGSAVIARAAAELAEVG